VKTPVYFKGDKKRGCAIVYVAQPLLSIINCQLSIINYQLPDNYPMYRPILQRDDKDAVLHLE